MTVENTLFMNINSLPSLEGVDISNDLNLFYIRQIGASLRKHVGIQDKLEREIKLRDGASRMLAACTHEDQLLEVAKTLHTSNARMYTYMAELQKLKTAEIMDKAMNEEGMQNESRICSGRIAISDIRIPLMWNDPERYSGGKVREASRYAVFCLVRLGSEVQDTELACTDKSTTDVNFRDVLVFEDVTFNFKMEVEVYAFPMSEESISAPTPQKLLSRLNRSIGKSEGKRIRDRLKESPAANMKMGPQFEKLGSLTLDLGCVEDHIKSHDITQRVSNNTSSSRTKPLLPLYGSLTCRLVAQPRCLTEKCQTGFLHFMDVIGGAPSWSYMWCEAKAGKLRCWMNPEDAASKSPKNLISLIGQDVRINEIEKSRQKRSNSFQVRDIERRHIFAAENKDDMTKWIKTLRQHKLDYAAWSVACKPSDGGGATAPMFIASPSPCKIPNSLLFDSSVRKGLVYEQMSIDSPTKPDLNPENQAGGVSREMIESNQSAPWAGLFSGALSRPMTKVTKLKDVQNIENSGTRPATKPHRTRTKSCDGLSCDKKNSHKERKPPVPRRPSEDLIKERKTYYAQSPVVPIPPPRFESLKSCDTSESCSETGLSDFCQSSDDVFLSSDENLLNSPASATKKKPPQGTHAKVRAPCRGRKKRRAPMPPTSDQNPTPLLTNGERKLTERISSKGSLSSASSLDDILEPRGRTTHHSPCPLPSPRNPRHKHINCGLDSDPEGSRSQISLVSNLTQTSNTSSGYKSDSEGLVFHTNSPMSRRHRKSSKQSDSSNCEIVVTEKDVRPKPPNKLGVKVLPMADHSTPHRFTRSHSLDADSLLHPGSISSSASDDLRTRFSSHPSKENMKKPPTSSKSDKLFMKILTNTPTGTSKTPFSRPIPAPRRSYLTAVESSKVPTPQKKDHRVTQEPKFEPPNEDIYATPIPKHLRPCTKKDPNSEPVYAQVQKVTKKSNPHSSPKVPTPKINGVRACNSSQDFVRNANGQYVKQERNSHEEKLKNKKYLAKDEASVYI